MRVGPSFGSVADGRLLERDAAKTAIDLNIAGGELKSLGEQVAER